MADDSKRKRTFTASRLMFRIVAALALATIVSDLVLYFAPNASLAIWNGWRFLALSRGQWYTLWVVSFALLLVAFLVQLCVNPRLRRWFSAKRLAQTPWKETWNFAPIFAVWLAGISVDLLRDHATLTDRIDAYWANVYAQPPCEHPEILTLWKLAERLDIEPDQAADALRREGFPVNDLDRSIAEIARMRYAPPVAVYNVLRRIPPATTSPAPR